MEQSEIIEKYVRRVMFEIMAVLWANGQNKLHVGGMMRLLGVPEECAAKHDHDIIDIAESFADTRLDNIQFDTDMITPAGTTVH